MGHVGARCRCGLWLTGNEDGAEEASGAAVDPKHGASAMHIGHAHDLSLTPGMPVEVLMRTVERSPLSYLAKPLTDYFSRSLREE